MVAQQVTYRGNFVMVMHSWLIQSDSCATLALSVHVMSWYTSVLSHCAKKLPGAKNSPVPLPVSNHLWPSALTQVLRVPEVLDTGVLMDTMKVVRQRGRVARGVTRLPEDMNLIPVLLARRLLH